MMLLINNHSADEQGNGYHKLGCHQNSAQTIPRTPLFISFFIILTGLKDERKKAG
ncbi:MAG: hypothetical protein ACOCTU_01580 [Bacteroidota bacterium]